LMSMLGNPDLMSPDGIHPNAAGARMIAAAILPFVRPLTGVSAATR
jgi:lysophospholipase L1-like esterase